MADKKRRFNYRKRLLYQALPLGITFIVFTFGLYYIVGRPSKPVSTGEVLQLLSYSSFVNSWGPGEEIVKRFKAETGVQVNLVDGGDGALLLEKMKLIPTDLVIGLDQFSLVQARQVGKWRSLSEQIPEYNKMPFHEPEFLPFDWGPMTFIYREGEVLPPEGIEDLLNERYAGSLSLEDPRTSTPGLQFYFWVIDRFGETEGLEFLKKLKPSLRAVSSSWSSAYGLFTKGEAKLAWSYLTSPVYHWVEEKNSSYKPSIFKSPMPVQVEYAGIPDSCQNCGAARLFVQFLVRPDIQKILMEKNYMFPVVDSVTNGTPFSDLPKIEVYQFRDLQGLLERKDELLEKWQELGL